MKGRIDKYGHLYIILQNTFLKRRREATND